MGWREWEGGLHLYRRCCSMDFFDGQYLFYGPLCPCQISIVCEFSLPGLACYSPLALSPLPLDSAFALLTPFRHALPQEARYWPKSCGLLTSSPSSLSCLSCSDFILILFSLSSLPWELFSVEIPYTLQGGAETWVVSQEVPLD